MCRALSLTPLVITASMFAGRGGGAAALAAEVEWGPEKDGIATRLVPLEEEYVLGRPMRFRLEVVNRTLSRLACDAGKVLDNPSVVVTGPDGGGLPHIKPSYLTNTHYASIGPGEVVLLLRSFDIASQYYISKPGRYAVHYKGTDLPVGKQPEGLRFDRRGRPVSSDSKALSKLRGLLETRGYPSNTVEIRVLPGELPPWQVAAGRLLRVLPEGRWKLSGVSAVQPREIGLPAQTRIRPCTQGDRPIGATIWETVRRQDPEALDHKFHGAKNVYWGRNERGHVYVCMPPAVEYVWADARANIADALGVADTAPATPERVVNIRKLREALLSRDPRLVAAAVEAHPEIIDADLGSTRKVSRWTSGHALAWATRMADPALAEVLLDSGADIDARTHVGTALHCAMRPELKGILRLLLARGADVNAKSRSGWTPLHVAALGGHAEAAKMLMDSGANINQKTEAYQKYTPLDLAARGGHLQTVKVLLAHGADVNVKGRDGKTPVDLAEERGHENVTAMLLMHDWD